MRIAFIVGRFPALSETFILNQITGLIDAGHIVDIFSVKRPDETKTHTEIEAYNLLERTHYIDIPNNKLVRAWKALHTIFTHLFTEPLPVLRALNLFRFGKEALSFSLLLTLRPFLDHGPYDILNCHFGKQGLRGMRLKEMGLPGKLVVTFHGYDISQSISENGHNLYDRLFEHAHLLMPVSEFWKQRLLSMGADPLRVQVHHMGIDVERFEFRPRQHGKSEPVQLFTVGRLVEKKGIEYSLKAVAQVRASHPDWNIRYVIIGDGPLRGSLEAQAQELGLQDTVEFIGSAAQDQVLRYMMESHLFLLPSVISATGDQEGIPVSMMEAMATGMPVLSTRHSGIPELVDDGKSGFLVEERSVDELAEKLEQMIQRPELWPGMGLRGRAIVENLFNIATLNRDLVLTYRRLLDKTIPSPRKRKYPRAESV